MRKLPTGILIALLAVPALALAGKKATSGDQTLQITSSLAPAKAKAKAATVKVAIDYESTNDGAQIKESTKSVILALPAGTVFHASARAQCTFSALNQSGPSACPAGSRVGTGTATADGRPTLADIIHAQITLFNGLDDTNPDGSPRDPAVPALLFFAKTTIPGVNVAMPFDIKANKLELDYPQPTSTGAQGFHLQKIEVTIPKGAGKPYVSAPRTCKRTWLTALDIANFDGPAISATSSQKCRK